MKNRTSRSSGFTLVEIMIVVAIIGLLAAIAIPNFAHARMESERTTCLNNLRQIDGAVQAWAAELGKAPNAIPAFTDISAYLKSVVTCPSGGTAFSDSYTLWQVTNRPTCNKVSSHTLPADTSS
jgi:prepilin-type N-terminal cleavage/methylation domain-containing protein